MEVGTMMQGDAYCLKIELKTLDEELVTPNDILDLEITVGMLSKTYSSGKLQYIDDTWRFPLTQKETFRFRNSYLEAQARVLWPSGDVEGVSLGMIYIEKSSSRKVL